MFCKKFVRLGLLALFMVSVASLSGTTTGCGNSDSGNSAGTNNSGDNNENTDVSTGTGTGNAAADTLSTQTAVTTTAFTVASQALASGAGSSLVKAATISGLDVPCSGGGTVSVEGDVASDGSVFSMLLDIVFNDCSGLNGTLTEDVNGEILAGGSFSYSFDLTGDVGGNGCAVSYDGFSIDLDVAGSSFIYLLNGGVDSTCGDTGVSCTWNNVDLLNDGASYASSCTAI